MGKPDYPWLADCHPRPTTSQMLQIYPDKRICAARSPDLANAARLSAGQIRIRGKAHQFSVR